MGHGSTPFVTIINRRRYKKERFTERLEEGAEEGGVYNTRKDNNGSKGFRIERFFPGQKDLIREGERYISLEIKQGITCHVRTFTVFPKI